MGAVHRADRFHTESNRQYVRQVLDTVVFWKPRQILYLEETEHRMAIECKSGVLWRTHSGENQDYMLKAGKRYVSNTKGKIVIEAIHKSCLDIEEN
jgi:hypothetical protein